MRLTLHPTRANTEIADAIRSARKGRRLTQEDLALAADISTKTLHNMENGTSKPRIDTLLRVLHALGLGLEIVSRAPTARIPIPGQDPEWE
jgi:transcriptional regulator with XRE-family HTH domain